MWPVLSKPSYKHVLTESKQQTNIYWSLDGTSLVWKFQGKGNIKQNCPMSGGVECRLFLELHEKISIFLMIGRLRVIREEATGGSTVATSNWPILVFSLSWGHFKSQSLLWYLMAFSVVVTLHEKLDLHKFTRCKYGAKKCKLGGNQKQRW